jgi:hypothetical protein
MAKRTAKELWDALDKATLDAELESELAMTPEERRQELVKEGYDVDELDAEADAFFASLPAKVAAAAATAASSTTGPEAPGAPPEPAPPAPKLAPVVPIRRPWRLVAFSVAACVALFLMVKAAQPPPPVGHPPAPTDRDLAEVGRDIAEARCTLKDWATCKANLDDAAKIDPDGESEPRVQKMRGEIAAAMAGHMVDAGP